MHKKMLKLKRIFSRMFIRDTFNRDMLVLLLISVLIGSACASAIAMGANTYFSKTLSNLVGDYGEYDIVIQVREEMKDDAAVQIQKILDDAFQGARLKEGPTLTGKTNFFIALPDQYRTKQVYEDLGKTFGSIPGGAGAGVVTEPRMTIRGVPDGAKNMLMEQIMQMDGVRFAFRDGSSVGVILTSMDKNAAVSAQIKTLLKENQIIEISFPVGAEPANPIRLGESIANDIQTQLKTSYAQNVSVDGKNDDMTYMVSTMMELKRFLQAYASQVVITPNGNGKLNKGDVIAFQGKAGAVPVAGNVPDKNNVLVEVTAVRTDGSADGLITQGDASALTTLQGYRVVNNVIGDPVGTVSYRNPRQELGNALNETSKFVGQVPGFAQDTQNMSQIAINALDNYSRSINNIDQTLQSMQSAGNSIQAATSGLAGIDTRSLQDQLDNSSRAMGGLIGTLQVVKLVSGDAGSAIQNLTATQDSLNSMKSSLGALNNVAADARQAKATIDTVVANGNTTIAALRSFDVEGARNNLASTNTRLAQLQQLNVPLISNQLQYMATAMPNLKDEDISHSVKILDKFIDGQAIPGQRIQILTSSAVSVDAVTPLVYKAVGHNNVSLYASDLGVIEPNTRAEVYQLLNEVRAVLAAMTAIIATILFLVLDHTSVMTVMRRKRLISKIKVRGWRGLLVRIGITFTAPERQYGMGVGALMLTAMFILGGGGIPYLPWIGVPVLGAVLGLIVANYAEKISPISSEEVLAGESLGLSFDEIMREIVIPSGRPGLLQKLNGRKVKFR